jgi:predicted Holliday junction resolvase-like endonuclease
MWQKFYEITNLLFNLGRDLQQNRADIKQLQAEMRELSSTTQEELRKIKEGMQRLAYEVQRTQENEAHEREKLEMRLEIQKLRATKQLPQPEVDQDDARN